MSFLIVSLLAFNVVSQLTPTTLPLASPLHYVPKATTYTLKGCMPAADPDNGKPKEGCSVSPNHSLASQHTYRIRSARIGTVIYLSSLPQEQECALTASSPPCLALRTTCKRLLRPSRRQRTVSKLSTGLVRRQSRTRLR